MYRKPIHTDQYLTAQSHYLNSIKESGIFCLFNRAKSITSDPKKRNKEYEGSQVPRSPRVQRRYHKRRYHKRALYIIYKCKNPPILVQANYNVHILLSRRFKKVTFHDLRIRSKPSRKRTRSHFKMPCHIQDAMSRWCYILCWTVYERNCNLAKRIQIKCGSLSDKKNDLTHHFWIHKHHMDSENISFLEYLISYLVFIG